MSNCDACFRSAASQISDATEKYDASMTTTVRGLLSGDLEATELTPGRSTQPAKSHPGLGIELMRAQGSLWPPWALVFPTRDCRG